VISQSESARLYHRFAYLAQPINFGDALYLSQQPLEQPKAATGDAILVVAQQRPQSSPEVQREIDAS
jgi:hypothetical protein